MDFFGRVGIDWQLIAAQMINFAVLLWFLGRFLYKPLLKGMEHGDLEEAERQLEVVRQGQEKLKAERQKSLGDLKRRSAALVADAQKVAEEIKAEARQQADDEKRRLIDKTNSLLKSQLEAADIPALARGNDIVGLFGPGFQGATARGVDVLVTEAALQDARAVLELD